MKIILFDDDTMEPLTVLSVAPWAANILREGHPLRIPVPQDLRSETANEPVSDCDLQIVTIKLEKFIRKGRLHFFAFTADSESALKLRSVFLPGQQGTANKLQQDAYTKGIVAALMAPSR